MRDNIGDSLSTLIQMIPNPVHKLEMNMKCVNGEVFKLLAHLEVKVRLHVIFSLAC